MDKLKMHSLNKVDANIAKIGQLFPNCLTERKNEKGEVEYAIDFDVLRQELSSVIVEGNEERYQFTWPDKKKSILLANAPIAKTLRPCPEESVDFDTTENLYIEGDNLDVLKLLQETYLGKVKMIYIDPPYNTGNDFVYEDDFAQSTDEYLANSGQYDEDGNRLVQNNESNGRFHTDWLNMIYPRLKIAKDLLTDDGVVLISIDDNEIINLCKCCDEIFGSVNFISTIAVQLNPRGRHLDRYVAKTHESVVIYAKNFGNLTTITGIEKNGRMVEEYNREDSFGKYRLLGLRNRNQAFNPITRPNLYYPLYVCPSNGLISTNKDSEFTIEVFPDSPEGIKTCWTWAPQKVEAEKKLLIAERSGNEWRVFRKDYLTDADGNTATTLVKSLWIDKEITNDYGRNAIKELFGSSVMDFPKSVELIKKIISIGSLSDSLIMDFFSGSATTAHAVMQLNAEDGGKRKYIMVQLPEKTDVKSEAYKAGLNSICEIGKERIRRAGKKILEEQAAKDKGLFDAEKPKLDIGFRVLKLDSTNMKDVYYNPSEYTPELFSSLTDNIKEDRTPEDLLFQVMLELGVLLSSKIEKTVVNGKTVFSVSDGALIACFDDDIDDTTVKIIAQQKPGFAVFRDSSMASDSVATNIEQIFETYSRDTTRKVL